jgi:hypothetical protein
MSKYFESYSFEVGSTSPNRNKTKYSFVGPADYIQGLKSKPVEVTTTKTVDGWTITSKAFDNGILKHVAEKMLDNRQIKIESIQQNQLPKFRTIEIDSYDAYNPTESNYSYVEVNDKRDRVSPEFQKLNEESEQLYEKRYPKSSIISVSELVHDTEFEKILKGVS